MAARTGVSPTPLDDSAVADLLALGRAHGLDAIGVTTAEPLDRARAAIADRIERGLDAGLPFTFRNPERSTTPTRSVTTARSIIVGARSYLLDEPTCPPGTSARVARYAWLDYYAPLRSALRVMAGELKRLGHAAVVFADDNSVVDREVAWRAGIGWYGKNANLLLPRAGSWFVLGSLFTSAELTPAAQPVADGCGSCQKCFVGCPTAAIIEPGVIDAHRCLAWLLQRPGIFPVEYRVALGNRLYGCDDCQDVCPPNIRFGRPRNADSAPSTAAPQAWVEVLELLEADDAALLDSFGRWYLHQREPRWLRRNALVILGNIGQSDDPRTQRVLAESVASNDEIVRAHAVWALRRLTLDHLVPDGDDHPDVRAEIDREVPAR
jgi:epoxyqueuosine reductase